MTDFARGDVLLELREQRRLSREMVAHEVGVTTKTLYTWERKSGPIKFDPNAKALGEFYGVDPEGLVTRDRESVSPASRGLVEDIRDYFGPKVDRHDQTLAENNRLLREQAAELSGARLDRQAIQELVARQNEQIAAQTELLEQQSRLIEEMREAQAALLEAARRQLERATEEDERQGEWDGVDRRRDERRHSG